MSLIRTVMLMLPSFLGGVVLMGIVGLPLAERRGRKLTEDEARIFEGVALARDHHVKPLAIAAQPALVEETLPAQFGTRAEHGRRAQIAEASQIPIGAEPADGRSGLTSPAVDGHLTTVARTSGNAAPPLDAQPPPRTGGPAGPDFWHTRVGETIDRAAVWLGRWERHWWHDYATGAHAIVLPNARPAAAILARLAIERETGLLPVLAQHGKPKPPPIDYSAYTDDSYVRELMEVS